MKMDCQFAISIEAQSGAPSPADRVAAYFRDLAGRGLGCATNNATVALTLGLSVEQVRGAKQTLIACGRLKGRWGVWQAIDGKRFSGSGDDDLETLKTALRRHRFSPVCDARVVDEPNAVPRGEATELIVGLRRMTIAEAEALAEHLESNAK